MRQQVTYLLFWKDCKNQYTQTIFKILAIGGNIDFFSQYEKIL